MSPSHHCTPRRLLRPSTAPQRQLDAGPTTHVQLESTGVGGLSGVLSSPNYARVHRPASISNLVSRDGFPPARLTTQASHPIGSLIQTIRPQNQGRSTCGLRAGGHAQPFELAIPSPWQQIRRNCHPADPIHGRGPRRVRIKDSHPAWASCPNGDQQTDLPAGGEDTKEGPFHMKRTLSQ